MTYILHLSDPHFGTEIPEVMAALEQWIGGHVPDLLVLSGDITQRARDEQFAAASAFLQRLPPCPRIIVPGNHDIPLYNPLQRLFKPYANYNKAFPEREGKWSNHELTFIGFDTTTRFRHARGRLSATQISEHFEAIKREPHQLVLACIHQPLDTALPEDRESEYLLVHSADTARLLAEKHVDVVLSGHVHIPLIATTRTAFPELQRHFILSGAGTALSNRLRQGVPNSFNTIHTDTNASKRSVTIREYHYMADSKSFTQHFSRTFSEHASGWVAEDTPLTASAHV